MFNSVATLEDSDKVEGWTRTQRSRPFGQRDQGPDGLAEGEPGVAVEGVQQSMQGELAAELELLDEPELPWDEMGQSELGQRRHVNEACLLLGTGGGRVDLSGYSCKMSCTS
jgi:hypothetical protein